MWACVFQIVSLMTHWAHSYCKCTPGFFMIILIRFSHDWLGSKVLNKFGFYTNFSWLKAWCGLHCLLKVVQSTSEIFHKEWTAEQTLIVFKTEEDNDPNNYRLWWMCFPSSMSLKTDLPHTGVKNFWLRKRRIEIMYNRAVRVACVIRCGESMICLNNITLSVRK